MEQVIQKITEYLKDEKEFFQIGIERETLRVTDDGRLAKTLHPEEFGEKLKNFHIKTDFCESQPELVTSPQKTVDEAYVQLEKLTEQLKNAIEPQGEKIWKYSMPCILPKEEEITIAIHPSKEAQPLVDYLQAVANKYGKKSQLICGIHFNFSFLDSFLEQVLQKEGETLIECRNRVYLKLLRNYMKYGWFILFLTGNATICHESFEAFLPELQKKEEYFHGKDAISLRCSEMGYHNKIEIPMDYTSVDTLTKSLVDAVLSHKLIDSGELFAIIKAKGKAMNDPVESLRHDGIQYLEIRNIDINPMDKCGISKTDMEFLTLFMTYLLFVPENQVEEGKYNHEVIARYGRKENQKLIKNGKAILVDAYVKEVLDDVIAFGNKTCICSKETMAQIYERATNPNESYVVRMENLFLKNRFKLHERKESYENCICE